MSEKSTSESYLVKRLAEYGLKPTDEINKFSWTSEFHEFKPMKSLYFDEHQDGIRINAPTVNGDIHHVIENRGRKFVSVYRIRYENPMPDLSGKVAKYKYSKAGYGNFLFIPPLVLGKLCPGNDKNGPKPSIRIPRLYVTEGEFKAFMGAMWGLDIVGIPGIHNFKQGRGEGLLKELRQIIDKCMVEEVVILYDSDLLDLSSKVGKNGKDATSRPASFKKSADTFRGLLVNSKNVGSQPDVKVYLAYINPLEDKAGLDDLLKVGAALEPSHKKFFGVKDKETKAAHKKRAKEIIHQLDLTVSSVGAGIDHENKFFSCFDITQQKAYDPQTKKQYWVTARVFQLENVDQFWDYHKTRQLDGFTSFGFFGHTYKIAEDRPIYNDRNTKVFNPVYQKGNAYYKKDKDGKAIQLTTFAIKLHYVIFVNSQRTVRIATFTNIDNQVRFTELEKADVTSTTAFKLKAGSWKGFRWFGNQRDLDFLVMLLEDESSVKEADMIAQLGHNAKLNAYVMANGIKNGSDFKPVDPYGICTLKPGKSVYLPYFSKLEVLAEAHAGDQWFQNIINLNQEPVTFEKWLQIFRKVNDQEREYNGLIGALFFVMALFSDIVYRQTNVSPILALAGRPESGKSTLARGIMRLFGKKKTPATIQSITPSATNRIASRYVNSIIWLDEWKNDIPKWKQEFIKSTYDRSGKVQSKFTNDDQTKQVQIHSPFMLSGQDIPGQGACDAAVFSRCIHVNFRRTIHNEKLLGQLEKLEEQGLTHITLYLASQRALIEKDFVTVFTDVQQKIKTGCQVSVESRLILNYTNLITPALILQNHGIIKLGVTKDQLVKIAVKKVLAQQEQHAATNEIGVFWQILDELIQLKDINDNIRPDFHYRVKGPDLFLQVPTIYDRYSRYGKNNNKRLLDKNTLIQYLEGMGEGIYKGKGTTFMKEKKNKQRCLVFDRIALMNKTGYAIWHTPLELKDMLNEAEEEERNEATQAAQMPYDGIYAVN